MKNLFNTTLYIFLAVIFLQSPSYGQDVTDVTRSDGVVMYRDANIGRFDFHSRPQDDFEFLYMRASDTSSLNNVVVTEGGMMLIGVDDLCQGLVALPPAMPDVKLFVDGGFDVAKYGSSLWSVISDERLKKNIEPLENSLALLQQIEFSNDLFYTGMNAIKELAERTEELEEEQAQNQILEERVEALENQMAAILDALQEDISPVVPEQQYELNTPQDLHIGTAKLFQNAPNPLHHTTKIRYYLPENTKSASIEIQDLNGQVLQQFLLNGEGQGEVTFNAKQHGLVSGTYLYTLKINGQVINSKKMILTN